MKAQWLVCALAAGSATAAVTQPVSATLSDAQVRERIIRESVAAYPRINHPGDGPCPYHLDSTGKKWAGRSAYSRPGGYSPKCYPSDISAAEVAAYRNRLTRLALWRQSTRIGSASVRVDLTSIRRTGPVVQYQKSTAYTPPQSGIDEVITLGEINCDAKTYKALQRTGLRSGSIVSGPVAATATVSPIAPNSAESADSKLVCAAS